MSTYILKVKSENIDSVILKLIGCKNVEINRVLRLIGSINVKAQDLDHISNISEVLTIQKQKNSLLIL